MMGHGVRVVGASSRVRIGGWTLAISAIVVTLVAGTWAAESPERMAAKLRARDAERAKNVQVYRHVDMDWRHQPVGDGPAERQNDPAVDRSIRGSMFVDNYEAMAGIGAVNNASAITSLKVASTTYDFQHNDDGGRMIATLGSGKFVHFAWMHWDIIPDSVNAPSRSVNYNAYSVAGGFAAGSNGFTISGAGGVAEQAHGGYTTIDVDRFDQSRVSLHQRPVPEQPSGQYASFVELQGIPPLPIFLDNELVGSMAGSGPDDDIIWPHLSIDPQTSGDDVMHSVSHTYNSNNNIYYWRFNGTSWVGPGLLDSSGGLSYYVAADRTSNKVAFLSEDDNKSITNPNEILQVTYREVSDGGVVWTDANAANNGTETFITSYNSTTGPGAWLDMMGDYDNAGNLHVIWVEAKNNGTGSKNGSNGLQSALKHFDKNSGNITTIVQGYWDVAGNIGGRDLTLAFPQLGFGDGSTLCNGFQNTNYLYVTFVQCGGVSFLQQNDVSAGGFQNRDIYLSESNDGGALWSPAISLSGAPSPGCNPASGDSCRSEHWASIARTIDDTIHIQYILDRDAGDVPFGNGSWTFNPVLYMRLKPGDIGANPADKQPVCPLAAPNFAVELSDANGPECEYNTPPNTSISENLILSNIGNASMTGVVSKSYISPPSGTWLSVTGIGAYTIPAGGASITYPVTMNAAGLAEGLYKAKISITHNDPTKTSPVDIPVDFFVFNVFYCPEYVTLNTHWLWLEVSSVERVAIARASVLRGLYRDPSSLSPDSGQNNIYDASLILAVPPTPDTLVYRNLYGEGNGQPGFRAQGHLTQTTDARAKRASAVQSTVDSLMGINVEYIFPQNIDSSEFVLIKYKLYNRTAATTFTGLIPGFVADLDVVPSIDNIHSQIALQNQAGMNTNYNLVYQQGIDSGITHLADKYLAGLTAIQPTASPRGWAGPNDPWLFTRPGGGFSEGYLYQQMVKSGFELLPSSVSGEDLHSVIVFEHGVTLGPTDTKHYVLGLVTSTGGPANTDLVNNVKKAWKFAFGWSDVTTADCIAPSTAKDYPYFAVGSHETGLSGGCSGCVVTKVSGAAELTLVPDANPCSGKIHFAGSAVQGPYTATFRVNTIGACSPPYQEDVVVTIQVTATGSCCDCPYPGDSEPDGFIDVLDVVADVDIAFGTGVDVQDPGCPVFRGDFNGDGFTDVLDVVGAVDNAFGTGAPPCNPCVAPCF